MNISEFIVELNIISGVITTKIPCYYVPWSPGQSVFTESKYAHIPMFKARSTLTEFLQTFVKFFTRTRLGRGGVNLLSFCYPPPVLAICICNFISINDGKKLSRNMCKFYINLYNLVNGQFVLNGF